MSEFFEDCFNSLIITEFEFYGHNRGYLTYDFPNLLTHYQFHGIQLRTLEFS